MTIQLPFRQTAIQNGRIVETEQSQKPPRSSSRRKPFAIVEHHTHAWTDAESASSRGEVLR